MFTENEVTIIEQWRGHESKGAAKELSKIWDKYHGTDNSKNCFCASQRRKAFIKNFYLWYEENN